MGRAVRALAVATLAASAVLVAVSRAATRPVEDFELKPLPTPADRPPRHPQGVSVEENWDSQKSDWPTVAGNWGQRGGLVRRATDADVYPPGFADANQPDVDKVLKPLSRAGRRKAARTQLSHVAGNEIVGNPAKVDEPGKGELIWSSDGTPVQPTPWDLQWDGGAPAWDEGRSAGEGAGGKREEQWDGAIEGDSSALQADASSPTFDDDFELAIRAAGDAEDKYLALSTNTRSMHRGTDGKPQEKHMWQYWATEDDDLKARAAGKVLKSAWDMQRKYLGKMKSMCPMCAHMPGPKQLSEMFCRTCEQFPESWGDKGVFGKPGARGEPFSGSPPNYLNDDDRPLHHTPMDKGTWWGDNDAWYDGWEQHRTDLWPPYQPRYTDELGAAGADRNRELIGIAKMDGKGDGDMINGGGWKAMADDLNRGGNDYPEYKRTGMAPEYWERPGDEHDLDNVGKVTHAQASKFGEEFLDAGEGGVIRGATSFQDDWQKIRPVDKLPPWCDRILGCPPPYNAIGEQASGRAAQDDKTTWSWPYNENGKKIQLGDVTAGKAVLKQHHSRRGDENSPQQRQAALLEAHAEEAEGEVSADMQTAEKEAVAVETAAGAMDGAAAHVTEPLDGISKMLGSSLDSHGAVVKAASVVPLFPPWAPVPSDQDSKANGEDDTNYPGLREWEWTGEGSVSDVSAGKEAKKDDAQERDRASARDRENLMSDHSVRTGWKAPVHGADMITDFHVQKSPRTQVLSEKALSKEMDYYLGSLFPGTFAAGK